MKYKFGFTYDSINYGWRDKHLYRLPQFRGVKFYGLKKLKKVKIGKGGDHKKNFGYYVGTHRGRKYKDKKTIEQLEQITTLVNFTIEKIQDKDVPF